MGDQQEELQKLRLQQHCLQDHLAARLRPQHVDSGDAASGAASSCLDKGSTNSLELQLQDLVNELRKLQQEVPEASRSPSSSGRSRQPQAADASAGDVLSILKELRDERAIVADMLDNVKKEKCEVIAMMHIFATSKSAAIEELDGLRHAARDELSAFAVRVRSSASAATVGRGRQSEVASARGHDDAAQEPTAEPVRIATMSSGGPRIGGSHAMLCPAAGASLQAPVVQLRLAPPAVRQQQACGASGVVCAASGAASGAATGSHDQRRHSTGPATAEPPIRNNCSPIRQQSAGVSATRLLAMNATYSPSVVSRPTIATSETQKSPVHRLISGCSACQRDAFK